MFSTLTTHWDKLGQVILTPSWRVVGVALLVASLPFLAGFVLITPSSFGNSFHPVIAKSPQDVRVFGFANAAKLSVDASNTPKVVLVGASSMQAAFDSQIIEEEILSLTGKPATVYNLAVDSQTIMEFIGMVEHIPEGSTGKLLLKVSPVAMTRDYHSADMSVQLDNPDRFTLYSPALSQELKSLGIRNIQNTGNFFLNNIVSLCARYKIIVRNLLLGNRFQAKHPYIGRGKVDQNHWNKQSMRFVQALRGYENHKENNFQYIRAVVDYVRNRTRMEVVLVEQLYSPRLLDNYLDPAFFARYQQDINQLANSLGIHYLDLPSMLNLDEDAFRDWTHLDSPAAIDKACEELVKASFSAIAS